jgi:hypothetical protein
VYYAIFPVMYVVSGISVRSLPEWIDRQFLMVIAVFVFAISALMMGPSQILMFPDSPIILALGFFLGGSCAFINIIALPEVLRQANIYCPGNEDHNIHFVAGIYNSLLGVG